MDDLKQTTTPAADESADKERQEKEALAKLEANTAEIKRIIADSKTRQAENTRKLDDYEKNIHQAVKDMKTTLDELDAEENKAADELDTLNLQLAEDLAQLDKEDEELEKSEEEEDKKETE